MVVSEWCWYQVTPTVSQTNPLRRTIPPSGSQHQTTNIGEGLLHRRISPRYSICRNGAGPSDSTEFTSRGEEKEEITKFCRGDKRYRHLNDKKSSPGDDREDQPLPKGSAGNGSVVAITTRRPRYLNRRGGCPFGTRANTVTNRPNRPKRQAGRNGHGFGVRRE